MAPGHRLSGKSFYTFELDADPSLELDYITAPPRMALYMKYSTDIYKIYLKYIAPEDIHVYSCDEVFMDVAPYLRTYGMTPHELAITMIQDVLSSTGITATAGIGTNMFLCKIAMDIVAKHMPADKDGVRIAELYEPSFREQLWGHTPLTDFWSIGVGTANLKCMTASSQMIINALLDLYLDITDRELMIRRVTICAARISRCMDICANDEYEQLDLFTDYEAREQQRQAEKERLQKERSLQLAELEIKEKYGRNAILKGTNFLQGAMTRERNMQIGGHKA